MFSLLYTSKEDAILILLTITNTKQTILPTHTKPKPHNFALSFMGRTSQILHQTFIESKIPRTPANSSSASVSSHTRSLATFPSGVYSKAGNLTFTSARSQIHLQLSLRGRNSRMNLPTHKKTPMRLLPMIYNRIHKATSPHLLRPSQKTKELHRHLGHHRIRITI